MPGESREDTRMAAAEESSAAAVSGASLRNQVLASICGEFTVQSESHGNRLSIPVWGLCHWFAIFLKRQRY